MSILEESLKVKIKEALDNAEDYNTNPNVTPEMGKVKTAEQLSKAIVDWLIGLSINVPPGIINVQGSSLSQSNINALKIPLKLE